MLDLSTRLPGVLCETRLPNLGQRPLRLDVAGFVGLAERGPLDVPVMIEDFSQYRLVFGGDLPVARVEGRPVFAHLSRTVEAFFENGGQRCYVVRVAGEGSRANRFQIPGLLYDTGGNNWQPVIVPAAWHGRWSDLVSVATSMRIRPLEIRVEVGDLALTGAEINDETFMLPLRLPVPNAVRSGDLLRLYINQAGAERYQLYVRAGTVVEEPTLGAIQLFGMPVTVTPTAGSSHLFRTNPAAVPTDSVAQLTPSGWVELPFLAADYIWSDLTADNGGYRLTMPLDSEVKIEAGTLLRISGPGGLPTTFMTAEQVQRGRDPDAGNVVRMIIHSDDPLQVVTTDLSAGLTYTVTQVDVLSFDLLIREGENTLENWADLRYSPEANYWANILQPGIGPEQISPAAFTVDSFSGRSLRLGTPPAGEEMPLPLPIGMGAAALTYFGPQSDPLTSSKDGLDSFDPVQLFIDDDFLTVGTRNLLATANDLLYLAPQPRRLRGMHCLVPIEEVALIAVPDLAHIGWEQVDPPDFTEPEPPEEPEEPKGFHDCPIPEPEVDDALQVTLLDPNTADTDPNSQAWLEDLPEQLEAAEHDDAALLDVQRALIRLCAARAEIVALLSLPQHYNTQAAGQWQQELSNTPDFFDGNPLSYAAVYHGWLAIREETTPSLAPLRYLPPDGFVGGMIAAREILRGAWIAPANVSLQNAVDLQPAFKDDGWLALYQRQMNIVRRQPGRYALMSALTLSRDSQLRQLNVRRLLILLRKLALREGQRYVFETNNERFRALVQTYFENILNRILERGGLQAFQVVTNEEINTPNDYDNGRFLIALKVAPTLPIEFITITMLRSGNDALSILERTT